MDNNRFVSNNLVEGRLDNITFENIDTRSDKYARSGIHSVALTKERPYAMTCLIKNVQAGEHFNISVYRHISNTRGCLVVSAEDIEKFYLVQHNSCKREGSWEYLDADFIVPSGAKGQNLKVYTWNKGSDTAVYFDDLTIRYVSPNPPEVTNQKGSLNDKRDNKVYQTVKIGNQWWMAENLAYVTKEGSCSFENAPAGKDRLGLLYSWETANQVAPEGWHLPTEADWQGLEIFLGMKQAEATAFGLRGYNQAQLLKESAITGFNAIPGGMSNETGKAFFFEHNDKQNAYFWTATEVNNTMAICREIMHRTDIGKFKDKKNERLSVRCIMN